MIRVYGVSVGYGSYARVTEGVCGALQSLGLLSGFVPVDSLDEWGEYEGATAPVSIVIAPQTQRIVELPTRIGAHDKRWLLLPLNSSWAPKEMLLYAERAGALPWPFITGFLTPSKWSAGWLSTQTSAEVQVWPHGIESHFQPDVNESWRRLQEWQRGDGFRVAHLSSTERQRKGTVPLVRAWGRMQGFGKLPACARLKLVLPSLPDPESELFEVLDAMPSRHRDTIEVLTRQNLSPERMADFLRQQHLVVQPSRGEGFGMVPLESLACGTPVVATACSGHSEYLSAGVPGTSIVPHGPDDDIDDGPGAQAPSVSMADVEGALLQAIKSWPSLQEAALKAAPGYQSRWSWEAVMREWATKEGMFNE